MGKHWRTTVLHILVVFSTGRETFCSSSSPDQESRTSYDRSESPILDIPSRQQPSLTRKPVRERPLSEILESLTKDDVPSDFHQRLLDEEQEQAKSLLTSQSTSQFRNAVNFLLKVAGAGSILLLAAHFLQGASLIHVWNDLSHVSKITSFLWFPFLWIRPSHMMGDSLSFAKFFVRSDLSSYVMNNMLPTMGATFKQIITAELWGHFWKVTSKKISIVMGKPTRDRDSEPGESYVPEWLNTGYSFVASTVEKGCTKLLQKTMQKHFHQSIESVSSFVMVSLRESLFQPKSGNDLEL
jgi:hypothetical protein